MPTIPANLDWLFLTIGGLLALGSLYLLFWSLFRDRARAKFRCPKCWYVLSTNGNPPTLPATCSECGRVTTKPKHLSRTRRRFRYALLAIALIPTAGVIAYYPSANRNGWLSIVPTRVLIDTMPVFGHPTFASLELARRCGITPTIRNGVRVNHRGPQTISTSDYAYLAHRIAKGSYFARPISSRWKNTFGRFHRQFGILFDIGLPPPRQHQGYVTDPVVRDSIKKLYELPPDVRFRTREVWPEGVPLFVECNIATWWPQPSVERVFVKDLRSNETYRASHPDGFVIDGLVGKSTGKLRLEVRVDWWQETEPDTAWTQRTKFYTSVPYRIAGSVDEIMSPVSDPLIDQLVASVRYRGGYRSIHFDVTATRTQTTRDIAFGAIIDHLLNGELKAVERAWWSGSTDHNPGSVGLETEWISDPRLKSPDQWRSPSDAKPGENWTVRIRSDPETALRVIDAGKYWQGDVTIPLTIR